MSRQDDESVQGPGGDRVLNFGAVRVHNGHLQSGRTVTVGCLICSEGLEGALATPPPPAEEPEVVKSNGGDESGDPTLALSYRPDYA